jgi:hypothetical protein
MNEPEITVRLEGNGRIYRPGETLAGEYRIDAMSRDQLKAIEVSVLWYTQGKGEEDMAVHAFWRRDVQSGDWFDPRHPEKFSATLPASPLSYEGQIVKIRWCVRVRAFLRHGKEVVGQAPFRLGCAAQAKASQP